MNERESVRTSGLWSSAQKAARRANAPEDAPAGSIVYINGQATCPSPLRDGELGVATARPALVLRRIVEQYMWYEVSKGRKHKMQIHTYHQGWLTDHVDSSKFVDATGHANLPMQIKKRAFMHSEASVCGFYLAEDMLDQIENCERLCPKAEQFEGLDGFLTMGIQHGWTYLRPAGDARRDHEIDMAEPSAEPSTELNILKRSVYISGKTLKNRAGEPTGTKAFLPWKSPQIGDLRVRWEVVSPQTVSIMSMHSGGGALSAWAGINASSDQSVGSREVVHMLRSGTTDCSAMVAYAQTRVGSESWEHRMFGFGTMTMGSFLYCHFMEYTTDFADVISLAPMMGQFLASLVPNTQSFANVAAVPLCSAALTLALCSCFNVGWRAFFMWTTRSVNPDLTM